MQELLHNNRFYILVFSLVFSLLANTYIVATNPSGSLQTIRLTQTYGFTAIIFLYLALFIGPFCYVFAQIPWKKQLQKARRAIGVSAFYFALLHGTIAFFGQLGGFEGLAFLTTEYLIAISASAVALFILMLMAMTSFDTMIKKITFSRWKILQRLVYVAGILILLHVVMLGTHFQDLTGPIARIAYLALALLFFFEAIRFDAWLRNRFGWEQNLGIGSVFIVAALFSLGIVLFTPIGSQTVSLGIHQQHTQSQQRALSSPAMQSSMTGDRTLRYTVSFNKPDQIEPDTDTPFSFDIYNAASGNKVNLYQKFNEKEAHLVVVDSTLQRFYHIHPEREGNRFSITTSFPQGLYRAYLSYQPVGAIEQQVGFIFAVGQQGQIIKKDDLQIIQTKGEKVFGKYRIRIDAKDGLTTQDLLQGSDTVTFTLLDAATNQPVRTLRPYLGAFGHLVMIHDKDFTYIHVHPVGDAPEIDQTGGPEVSFIPMALLDPVRPGIYRMFAEFDINGEKVLADFSVRVK